MPTYTIGADARKDLEEIARYTLTQWGEGQSLRYAAQLEACFSKIGLGNMCLRQIIPDNPAVGVCKCEHHYIFVLRRNDTKPLIIAVLHERMDLMQRLKGRL